MKSARIPELDGLRGVAILLVVSFHYLNNQLTESASSLGKIIGKATGFGWIGVDLFFVLSGFLIGNIILRYGHSGSFFKAFYIKRILRIIPNYFLLIFIFLVIAALPYFSNAVFLTHGNIIPGWSYFAMVHNFYMAGFANMGANSMSITWSIGIEEQFYLTFPFILLFIRRKHIPWVLVALIALAPFFRSLYADWVSSYVLIWCRMDALSFGVLGAWLMLDDKAQQLTHKYYQWLLVLLAVDLLIAGFLYAKFGDLGVFKQTFFSVAFLITLLIAINRTGTLLAWAMRIQPLRWVGQISYSLYLFHYIILGLFHFVILDHAYLGLNTTTDVLVTIGATVFSLFFSWLVYISLESPLVNFGKRYKY